MAGKMALLLLLLAFVCTSTCLEINYQVCRTQQSILRCPWRGVAKYEVEVPLMQEILLMDKLTVDSFLIVPERYAGRLLKIEVLQGDVTCTGIVAPSFVSVYVGKQRCMKMMTSTPSATSYEGTSSVSSTLHMATPTMADFTFTTETPTTVTSTATVTVTRHDHPNSPERQPGKGEILSTIFGVVIDLTGIITLCKNNVDNKSTDRKKSTACKKSTDSDKSTDRNN